MSGLSEREQWAPTAVAGYEASSEGRVRSVDGEVLKQSLDGKGYPCVTIRIDGVRTFRSVHRLVAAAFYGESALLVRHLNGTPTDNRVENLAYGTQRENGLDSVRHGTHANARKTHCPKGHPYSGHNLILKGGGAERVCRACRNQQRRNRRAALRLLAAESQTSVAASSAIAPG